MDSRAARLALPLAALAALAAGCGGTSTNVPAADTGAAADTAATPDVPVTPGGGAAVTQYQYDPQRTGANRAERQLTPEALRSGRLRRDSAFAPSLDGQVYAQPLYLPGVSVGATARDLLFVATQANSLYALDAATGAEVWRTALGAPVPRASQPCGNITPTTGVLGTPVIDPAARTLYAVAFTTTDGGRTKTFRLNALDVATGAQRAGYPADIRPSATNGSTFDPSPTGERGALALLGGRVYVPFGGLFGDCGTYHGWVVGIDAAAPATQSAWATPGRGSGIWAPGGVSSDGASRLFAATGNGFGAGAMGEYVVRLGAGPTQGDGDADFFSPSDASRLDAGDVDIGSVAPVVLPDHAGSRTPHLLFQGGKAGVGYLIDRDDLGGRGGGNGTTGEAVYSARLFSGGNYGAAGAWTDGGAVYVFVPGRGTRAAPCTGSSGVMALQLRDEGGGSAFRPVWCTDSLSNPSPPVVSSNGNADAVLWVASAASPALHAYDVATGMKLWEAGGADRPTSVRQWVPVVVADGRVYVTGNSSVAMYRLQ